MKRSLFTWKSVYMSMALLACTTASYATAYSICDIGSMARPTGINSSGVVIGVSSNSPSHAFVWQNGTKTLLPELGGTDSAARGINDLGQIVGCADMTDGTKHAVLWNQGNATDLGAGGGALAINNKGQMAGWQKDTSSAMPRVITKIDTLAARSHVVTHINDSGQIIGYFKIKETANDSKYPRQSYKQAFLYQNGQVTDLGTLGGEESIASYINSAGEVAGTCEIDQDMRHAFLYANGTITDLCTLGGDNSQAEWINNTGQVVGSSQTKGKESHAFIWQNGKMTDLNGCATTRGSKWVLREATAINDAGQIVGLGLCDGVLHGFLLTPVAENTNMGLRLDVVKK